MKQFLMTILCTIALLTAACGGNSSDGTLKVMLNANVISLDTAQAADFSSLEVIADCIDGLMQLDAGDNAIPAIAQSFDVSADGKTYTFHLRDAQWANGDDVTADDFVFAWCQHCQKANEYAYMFGSTVACVKNADAVIKGESPELLGVSAPDPKTFVVELDAPVSFFPSLMTFPTFYPINEKFYSSLAEGTYGTSPETFLSNGAFVLTNYAPGADGIQLVKNDKYWDAARVALKGIQYEVITSGDDALVAFKNKKLDVVQIAGDQIVYVKDNPKLIKNLKIKPEGSLTYLTFNQDPKNHHAGALANVNLRLAISHAIDRELLVEDCIMDGSRATYTAVPVDFAPNAKTGKFFAEDQMRYADYVAFDVERAQMYFEKAKSELGADTVDLNLIYANDSGDTVIKIVREIKTQVEEHLPGVILNLQPVPKTEFLNAIRNDNYDTALMTWGADYNDPMTFLTLWTTEGTDITEHWSNAAYDKIIADCTTGALAADYDARWKAMYDAEKIVLENAVIAPLYTGSHAILVAIGVEGLEFHATSIARVFKSVFFK